MSKELRVGPDLTRSCVCRDVTRTVALSHIPVFMMDDDLLPPYKLLSHGPLTRYVKLRVAHAPGILGMRSHHASRHVRDARAVMHAGIANPQWRGKHSQHSLHMRNQQFYVSDKRPIESFSRVSMASVIKTAILHCVWINTQALSTALLLFTKTPSYWYEDSHYKPETVFKPS